MALSGIAIQMNATVAYPHYDRFGLGRRQIVCYFISKIHIKHGDGDCVQLQNVIENCDKLTT